MGEPGGNGKREQPAAAGVRGESRLGVAAGAPERVALCETRGGAANAASTVAGRKFSGGAREPNSRWTPGGISRRVRAALYGFGGADQCAARRKEAESGLAAGAG